MAAAAVAGANGPGGFNKRKVLLMGKGGSGKTSMRSIIFANYLARETTRLGPTLNQEVSNVQFLGNLVLNLWDCGGQARFMERYFQSQRDRIFRNVEVLIYVFDIESDNVQQDEAYFQSCLSAIKQHSPDARIFCLIHKMDLIPTPQERQRVYENKTAQLQRFAQGLTMTTFGTSIWDETLYKAWSAIVYSLVPNVEKLQHQLARFCGVSQADEMVLFERSTFLVISHASRREHPDVHRYEKISNIIKQFKLSCSKTTSQFYAMEVKNRHFTAYVDAFTSHTYIMIVTSHPDIHSAAIKLNVAGARQHFEKLVRQYVRR